MYGWWGVAKTSARRRLSTIRPAYIVSDTVGHLADHAEVVSDEHHRHPVLALQSVEQLEHLGLHGHVEGGRRLVGDQQLRAQASAIAIITRWRMPPENWCG